MGRLLSPAKDSRIKRHLLGLSFQVGFSKEGFCVLDPKSDLFSRFCGSNLVHPLLC